MIFLIYYECKVYVHLTVTLTLWLKYKHFKINYLLMMVPKLKFPQLN